MGHHTLILKALRAPKYSDIAESNGRVQPPSFQVKLGSWTHAWKTMVLASQFTLSIDLLPFQRHWQEQVVAVFQYPSASVNIRTIYSGRCFVHQRATSEGHTSIFKKLLLLLLHA